MAKGCYKKFDIQVMGDGRTVSEWVSFQEINDTSVFIKLWDCLLFFLIGVIFAIGNKIAIENFAKIGPDRNFIFDSDFIFDCENKVDWPKTRFIL